MHPGWLLHNISFCLQKNSIFCIKSASLRKISLFAVNDLLFFLFELLIFSSPRYRSPDDEDALLALFCSALVPNHRIKNVYHYYVGVLFGMLEKFARKLNLLDCMTTVHSEIRRIRLSTDNASKVQITSHLQSTLKYNLYLSVNTSSATKDMK